MGGGYVVQKVLKQHESLSRFNSSSVNSIRITTLFWRGKIYTLGGIFKIGAPGEFCSHTAPNDNGHRSLIALDDDGRLTGKFIDSDSPKVYDDCYGLPPSGIIPKYRQMTELAVKEHSRFPNIGIIGWDITLDENENIICIEYNPDCPGIITSQYVLGPILAKRTSRGNMLLDEIMYGI